MINSVRNTVMSVLNKNNYGYLSPADFNLFAKQAQLELFEDYFFQLNYQINKENFRQSGIGLADITQQIKEGIEIFIEPQQTLTQDTDNLYFAPSVSTTGSDYYLILGVYCYGGSPRKFQAEATKVSNAELMSLLSSNLSAPSRIFPYYVLRGDKIMVYPDVYNQSNSVECLYVRYPKDPKWTFVTLAGGSPVFNQSQPDFQDFELPKEDEVNLVVKICQYAGVMIREQEVYQFAKQAEMSNTQSEQ